MDEGVVWVLKNPPLSLSLKLVAIFQIFEKLLIPFPVTLLYDLASYNILDLQLCQDTLSIMQNKHQTQWIFPSPVLNAVCSMSQGETHLILV